MSEISSERGGRHMPRPLTVTLRVLSVLLVTAVLAVIAGYGLLHVLILGPSPAVSNVTVRTLHETRRGMHVPELFLSDEEIDSIINIRGTSELGKQDLSMIQTPQPTPSGSSSQVPSDHSDPGATAVPGGHSNTNSNIPSSQDSGVEVIKIIKPSFTGVLVIVKDPSRMFLGTLSSYEDSEWGMTLPQMCAATGASGGINAGGFVDEKGRGTGSMPNGLVIKDGKILWGTPDTFDNVVGFDSNYILHVGYMTGQEALDADIQFGVTFGPVLVFNGRSANLEYGGLNPRSAIGQRADRSVMLLTINGRTLDSMGATFADITNIMLEYGAVNACNLDGGSSCILMYNGEILNVCPSTRGPRPIPTAFMFR